MTIDQATRDEIQERHDLTLLVEAGAGTGKTTVLVKRVAGLLLKGLATIDDIAVITFTEKAAAELATRLRERLEDEPGPTAEAALAGLHRARIETIHAFAMNLLRERPVEAGIDPRFAVLDDLQGRLGFDEAYRRWLRDLLDDPPPALATALNRGIGVKDLRDAARVVHDNRARSPFPIAPIDPPDVTGFVTDLRAALPALIDALTFRCLDENDNGAKRIRDFQALLERIDAATTTDAAERAIIRTWIGYHGGAQKCWQGKGTHATQKATCDRLRDRLLALAGSLRAEAVAGLIPLFEAFALDFAAKRRAAGRAEFDDLLIWARDLLRERPDVRRYFQRRFRYLLIDEFQDTDPLQAEIALLLAGDGPVAGRLFFVGDPKQSIYRFRRADMAIYERVKAQVIGDGHRRIVQNFRSLPGVIGWVNRVFGGLIIPTPGVQPEYVDLVARPDDRFVGPHVAIVRYTGEKAADRRAQEAALLAATIQSAVGEWTVREGTEIIRPARQGDVALLLPSRTGIDVYERALADAGLRYRHEGGKAFFNRQEVRDLIAVLRAVDDPANSIAVVAALRSPAFGCSDDDLFRYVDGGGALDGVPEGDGIVAAALRTLDRIRADRGRRSLPALVEQVLAETRLVEFALLLPAADQATANVLKVVDSARQFAAAGGGLRAFVQWVEANDTARGDEADALVSEHGDDVVRILTMHGAKGLEFPIVALANLDGERYLADTLIFDESGAQLKVGKTDGKFQTPGYEAAKEREKTHGEAERRRLLYVAATRARDHLIVPARQGEKASGVYRDLLEAIGDADDQWYPEVTPTSAARPAPHEPPAAEEVAATIAGRDRWQADRAAMLAAASVPTTPRRLPSHGLPGIGKVALPSGEGLDSVPVAHRDAISRALSGPTTQRARGPQAIIRPAVTRTIDGQAVTIRPDLAIVADDGLIVLNYVIQPPDLAEDAIIADSMGELTGQPVQRIVYATPDGEVSRAAGPALG